MRSYSYSRRLQTQNLAHSHAYARIYSSPMLSELSTANMNDSVPSDPNGSKDRNDPNRPNYLAKSPKG